MIRSIFIVLTLATTLLQAQVPQSASVYRDVNGVPHIEADTEEAAYYALGFEHARDCLYWIQANVMRQRGQAAEVLNPNEALNDLIVKAMNTHFEGFDDAELKAMFRLEDEPSQPDQFYDNTKAYAAGVNAYRLDLLNSNVPSNELPARAWLDVPDRRFALDNEVTVRDFLSWGRWQTAQIHWSIVQGADPTFVRTNPLAEATAAATAAQIEVDLGVPASVAKMKEAMKDRAGGGSNSYAWSHHLQNENGQAYTGSVADPHQVSTINPFIYSDLTPGSSFSITSIFATCVSSRQHWRSRRSTRSATSNMVRVRHSSRTTAMLPTEGALEGRTSPIHFCCD